MRPIRRVAPAWLPRLNMQAGQGLTQYALVPGCIALILWLAISGVLSLLLDWPVYMVLLLGCGIVCALLVIPTRKRYL